MVWKDGRVYNIANTQELSPIPISWDADRITSHTSSEKSCSRLNTVYSIKFYVFGRNNGSHWTKKKQSIDENHSWEFCKVKKMNHLLTSMEMLSHHKANFCFLSNECLVSLDVRIRTNEALHEPIQNSQDLRQYWTIFCQSVGWDCKA